MHIPSNIGKSTLLATCIFWTINFSKDFDSDIFLLVFMSIIPICISVTAVIIGTICPIFWLLKKENESNTLFFKKWFPIYTILAFSLCVFGAVVSNLEFYLVSFYITVYITTAQSWVWFAKEK